MKSKAMNAHKMMAGADKSFSVSGYPGSNSHMHITPATGEDMGSMSEAERAAKPSAGKYGDYNRQAHPDHGPMHDHFDR